MSDESVYVPGHISTDGTTSANTTNITNNGTTDSTTVYIPPTTVPNTAYAPMFYEPYNYININEILNDLGIKHTFNVKGRCNSCNKENSEIILSYKIHMDRNICKNCCKKLIDKMFGITINEDTEKLLYGDNK